MAYITLDASQVQYLLGSGANADPSAGLRILNQLSEQYDIVITDRVYDEVVIDIA